MISIVNYGMGNIRSVQSALAFLGIENRVANSADEILTSDKLILPGVGSFRQAMDNISDRGLLEPLCRAVSELGVPILGICLGMQLLAESGDEDGPADGLGWIPGEVKRFQFSDPTLKVPHVGFNSVQFENRSCPLFARLGSEADFYFVHSYRFVTNQLQWAPAWTEYGERFSSVVWKDNVFGTQFHPEKSQSNGLKMLRNFSGLKL